MTGGMRAAQVEEQPAAELTAEERAELDALPAVPTHVPTPPQAAARKAPPERAAEEAIAA